MGQKQEFAEKNHLATASRIWFVSHVTRARLEPTAVRSVLVSVSIINDVSVMLYPTIIFFSFFFFNNNYKCIIKHAKMLNDIA